MGNFTLRFVSLLLIAYGTVYLPLVRTHVIGPFTEGLTRFAGWLIYFGGDYAWVEGNTLAIPGFAVQISDMCNGVEATIILWTAILSFPGPWLHKLKGLLAATLSIHALNIVRVISLVYLGLLKPEWFYWVHWYLWDVLIMLDILIVFLVWIRLMPAPGHPDEPLAA